MTCSAFALLWPRPSASLPPSCLVGRRPLRSSDGRAGRQTGQQTDRRRGHAVGQRGLEIFPKLFQPLRSRYGSSICGRVFDLLRRMSSPLERADTLAERARAPLIVREVAVADDVGSAQREGKLPADASAVAQGATSFVVPVEVTWELQRRVGRYCAGAGKWRVAVGAVGSRYLDSTMRAFEGVGRLLEEVESESPRMVSETSNSATRGAFVDEGHVGRAGAFFLGHCCMIGGCTARRAEPRRPQRCRCRCSGVARSRVARYVSSSRRGSASRALARGSLRGRSPISQPR